ncbi:GTP-binding conserved hypothetical domain-containing protein, putative [Eimeria mitis]|uniref:GTP-binding conserved hypothetical domain-containing protein, putative n=1 Tax=Eimeria mitis TaxID=44415 RepID=U6K0M7_9EIME|nr:GTP-binding conserved hypothetical domain-containing protein, putative [Eimeria mitis]CDJ31300.1 GTP-binding conserved hypothetical domain-containing protein, putative [Eimeria mitis]
MRIKLRWREDREGDPQSVSARCPFFLQQLKPRLRLWKKALTAEELPPPLYPEVAFAGRSNAGKSTLLNELCGRSGTAAVSRRPGSTQELFFFKAGSPCCLCLVDLPGYGYAEADAAKRLQWTEMSLFYLKSRPNLKRVFLLIDARWGLKASDVCLLSFFERHRIPFQLVLTKADLPEQKSLIKILQIVCFRQSPLPEVSSLVAWRQGSDEGCVRRLGTGSLALQVSEEVKKFKGCAGPPLPAANLAEARRLKKEARKREKAMSSSSTAEQKKTKTKPGPATTAAPGVPQEQPQQQQQQQQAQALDDPVARALERWGAPLASTASAPPNRGQTQREGDVAGDKFYGSAATEAPTAENKGNLKCEPRRLMSVSPQAAGGADALVEAEFVAEEVSVLRENSLSSALAEAVDRAEGELPLPDMSCAEALIRDLLPPPSCRTWQACESTEPKREPPAQAFSERSANETNTDAARPSLRFPDALHSPSLREVTSSVHRAEPADPGWVAPVFREVCLDSSGAARSSAVLQGCGPQGAGFKGHGDCNTFLQAPDPSSDASSLAAQYSRQEEAHLQLSGDESPCAAVQDGLWEDPTRPASKRPLDLLRAKDWRARRVGRAAVEIDMGLPETKDAAGNIATLRMGSCNNDDTACTPGMSPCLSQAGEVLSADFEGGAPLGGAIFLDEEALAAEDLGGSATRARGRIGSAPDPANYTGAHELDMQRSFDQKWRHELLPVGGASQASKLGGSKTLERPGAGGAQRTKMGRSNPFRIPEDYICTNEDRTKATTKRLALEIRLQRAQEAHRPTDGSQASEERNRSTADSLLFSAAQRRQERRLKELAKKSNKGKGRSKEMTWDVAYRKWARWARAHPALAREAPRPSKAQLLADFRQKLEKKANRRRKELQQRNSVAQPEVAGGRRTVRQSIEEIRKEAREAALQQPRR